MQINNIRYNMFIVRAWSRKVQLNLNISHPQLNLDATRQSPIRVLLLCRRGGAAAVPFINSYYPDRQ